MGAFVGVFTAQLSSVATHPSDAASLLPSLSNKMSYKRVVDSKRARREEAIREAVALTSRELTKEDQRVVSSSGS